MIRPGLILMLMALGAATRGQAQSSTAADPLLNARSKGSPTAPVTVYEMSDFQCPFCRRQAIETFPELEHRFVETGKVRWVFINFPLTQIHPNSAAAAEFAMCAAQAGKFWPVHDLLFKYQDKWAPLKEPGPFLLSLADSAGLGRDTVLPCLQQGAMRALVKADAEGAARSGAGSTPTFYIEGGLLEGAAPVADFVRILDSIYAAKAKP
jgi:protein-disulfide isomerase